MDQKWMNINRLSTEYWNGVEEFIKFAVERVNNPNRIKYPCISCGCLENVTVEVLKNYLFVNGIDKDYTRWIWHGESVRDRPINSDDKNVMKEKKSIVMRVIN